MQILSVDMRICGYKDLWIWRGKIVTMRSKNQVLPYAHIHHLLLAQAP